MQIPEHVRSEIARLNTLLEHHASIVRDLEAQRAHLLHASTGVNVLVEDVVLDVATWFLHRKVSGVDATPTEQ